MKRIIDSSYLFWFLLLIPSIPMVIGFASDTGAAHSLLHPSGEFSARFMILALALTPLQILFPRARWINWLVRRRRYLGVAAFGYALLHTVFYIVDMGALQLMLDEFWALGIWTGWAAFAIFVPLAITSNNASQRLLGRRWKLLQRAVYFAAVLTLVHWIFVHNNLGPALVHFVPLALLEVVRIWKRFSRANDSTTADSGLSGS